MIKRLKLHKGVCLVGILFLLGCSTKSYLPDKLQGTAPSIKFFLQDDVNAVINDYDVNLKIKTQESAIYSVHKSVTILNADAREHGRLVLRYGGFQQISSVKGGIYNAEGNLIRHLNEDDSYSFNLSDEYSIYLDNNIKTYQLYHNQFPYTIVYDYEVEYSGLLNLPSFTPQGPHEYVENARLKVSTPATLGLYHYAKNLSGIPRKSEVDKDSIFIWEVSNLKPLNDEPMTVPFNERMPQILLASDQFKMANSSGKLDSWNNFGKWYYSLAEGRNKLPENSINKIRAIYEAAPDRLSGVKALYDYMQKQTRYVSIQLGIGGWQPFEASFVEQKGYGDCKALTNYMQSILKYAGIESYPVLIKHGIGESAIVEDFPSNQFNHVILYIPGDNPIWLESTNQSIPFNYIGLGNANRKGLLVKPDTSYLINTPDYDEEVNWQSNKLAVNIDPQGITDLNIKSHYSGYYLDDLISSTANKSSKEREKWLHEILSLHSFSILNFNFNDIDKKKVSPSVELMIRSDSYTRRSGDRLFVPLNKLNRWEYDFPAIKKQRREWVKLPFAFKETDEITVSFPRGFSPETVPPDINIENSFGSYSIRSKQDLKGNIIISRSLVITEDELRPEKYNELADFFTKVKESDNKKIVLQFN